ncbi:hypothetical protein BDV95DRAFT_501759 [Massariosphaeria phaeospora]|uniref:Uncharacterized protein n=1 Tax=Massariosphaeria phaeospora TaxID=100035 RepID=A0A7C8I8S3_9PLEO|nr:hypothetical protein BDV95DRAFT_501759 [Massariosphaeria phaeospora]
MTSAINATGPWTTPLNWGLELGYYDEPHIRFSNYVRDEPRCPWITLSDFPQFPTLPVELQFNVISLCEIPTLFQLMQVSRAIRAEAKKYFWSDPDAWNCVRASLLVNGGLPGHTFHEMDYLVHVQHLEIEFDDCVQDDLCDSQALLGSQTDPWLEPSVELRKRISSFWQTVQRTFPRLTRISVSEHTLRQSTDPLPPGLMTVLSMCPAGISAFASFLQRGKDNLHPIKRTLWRGKGGKNNSPANEWEEINPTWTRKSITPPPKQFCGPVGMLQSVTYQFHCRFRPKDRASRFLLLEAIERHHFDGRHVPIDCFEPGCGARFDLPGQWTLHALETEHDDRAIPSKELKPSFDQHEEECDILLQKITDGMDGMHADWGEGGSANRLNAEQEFLHQLDNDPLYYSGKPAKETELWAAFKADMNDP